MATRGPYAKTAATREQILDAALAIIAEQGYGKATLQEIADAVGMSKTGLLHHFGSREELLTAVLARRDDVDSGPFVAAPDLLDAFVRIVRHNQDVPGLVALFSAFAGAPTAEHGSAERERFFAARYPLLLSRLADGVRREQEEGLLDPAADPTSVARLLVAAADGLQTQWLLDPDLDMVAHLRLLLGAFRSGSSPRGATGDTA